MLISDTSFSTRNRPLCYAPAIGGLAAGSAEIVAQCITKGSDNLDYSAIAIETFAGSIHGAIDGVAATATSIGTRVLCKAGKVALSGITAALHGSNNQDSVADISTSVIKSMGGSLLIQSALLGMDCYNGYFTDSIMSQRMIDGAASYGVAQMMQTAMIRTGANMWRNRKGIWDAIFE